MSRSVSAKPAVEALGAAVDLQQISAVRALARATGTSIFSTRVAQQLHPRGRPQHQPPIRGRLKSRAKGSAMSVQTYDPTSFMRLPRYAKSQPQEPRQ